MLWLFGEKCFGVGIDYNGGFAIIIIIISNFTVLVLGKVFFPREAGMSVNHYACSKQSGRFKLTLNLKFYYKSSFPHDAIFLQSSGEHYFIRK